MGDYLDELMDKRMPEMRKRLTRGLSEELALERFLPVDRLDDSSVFRSSGEWKPEDGRPAHADQALRPPGDAMLRKYQVDPDGGAFELSVAFSLDVPRLRDDTNAVLDDIQRFARAARLRERRVMLWLVLFLIQPPAGPQPFALRNLRDSVTNLPGAYRLLSPNHAAATAAKDQGLVEDVVNPGDTLPDALFAMLIPLGGGPTVQRIVNDLTPSWHREDENTARLALSERFFIVDGGRPPLTFRRD